MWTNGCDTQVQSCPHNILPPPQKGSLSLPVPPSMVSAWKRKSVPVSALALMQCPVNDKSQYKCFLGCKQQLVWSVSELPDMKYGWDGVQTHGSNHWEGAGSALPTSRWSETILVKVRAQTPLLVPTSTMSLNTKWWSSTYTYMLCIY